MAERSLPEQIERLRQEASRLKADLDETLHLLEEVSGQLANLAHEAGQVVTLVGARTSARRFSWGLALTLALGAGTVWLVSPGTFEIFRNAAVSQIRKLTGAAGPPHLAS